MENTNNFLSSDYKKPERGNKYFKFLQGDNTFRVLSPAITGWEDWTPDKKPVRTKDKPQFPIVQGKYPKHFWAFVVFDYTDTTIKVMQITQAGIQDELYNLATNKAWGDPKGYDVTIKRTGEGMETKYSVIPSPPSALNPEIETAYSKKKVTLEKLFENGDPFEDEEQVNPPEGHPAHPQADPAPTQEEQVSVDPSSIPF